MSGIFVLLILFFGLLSVSGLIWFLLSIGVIVQKSGERPHLDHGNYSMDQGHEVKAEDDQ